MYEQTAFLERVQKLAIDKHTTLKAVTRELNISASSFTDWKNGRGKPSIETFCKIAEYFGVTTDYLAFGTKQSDLSNYELTAFNAKFASLPPEFQRNVLSYIDGISATLATVEKSQLA